MNNVKTSIIREKIDIFSDVFHRNSESTFPNDFKFVEIVPIFKRSQKKIHKT